MSAPMGQNYTYRRVDHTGPVLCVCVAIIVIVWILRTAWSFDHPPKPHTRVALPENAAATRQAIEAEGATLQTLQNQVIVLRRVYDDSRNAGDVPRANRAATALKARLAVYREVYEGRYMALKAHLETFGAK